jgi:signal transduction histidine kinase
MPEKILIVDDEYDVELLITQQFRKAIRDGIYQFIFSTNGTDALQVLQEQEDIGLVVTDINMPDMDGLTLLARIKELPRHIRVIVVSAYNDMDNIRTAMNRGAFDFLTKPIDFSDYTQTLDKTIQEVSFLKHAHRFREQLDAERLERARAEEREKLEQQFLANMSHEIRTPLNAVYGMTRLLKQQVHDEQQLSYINGIILSCENLIVIINDILDLSKVKAGRMTFDQSLFKPADIVEHITNIMGFKANEKGLKLLINLDKDVPEALIGDPVRLNQVLINLIGNAIKFTERGSVTIQITGNHNNNHETFRLVCSISDTGIGMKPEDLDKVFEKFTQANTDIVRKYGGTGLGLTISKKLIEAQGGTITVTSEPGKGSQFSFEIDYPLAREQQIVSADKPSELDIAIVNQSRILLAEDNPFNRMVAVGLIKAIAGHTQIDTAEHGLEVLEMIATHSYDVIIMDVQMPELDGIETIKQIRASGNTMPIIILTAGVTPNEQEQSFAAGANDFVPKPFDPGVLIKKLASVIR